MVGLVVTFAVATNQSVIVLRAGAAPICTAAPQSRLKPGKPNGIVSAEAVAVFFKWAAGRRPSEVVEVWKEATRLFSRVWVIENYPDSLVQALPRQTPMPLRLIQAQLEKEGINPDEVEAFTMFKGDDGLIQRDVILAVAKKDMRIVGVYQGFWGR